VTVVTTDPRIQVVDYQPQVIPVQLDPVASKQMPVTVQQSQPPPGISTGPPQIDPSTVEVRRELAHRRGHGGHRIRRH
jgi:hypothetical protein